MAKKKKETNKAWNCTTYYWSTADKVKESLKKLKALNKRHRGFIRNFEQRRKLLAKTYELEKEYIESVIGLYQGYVQDNEANIKLMSATLTKKH